MDSIGGLALSGLSGAALFVLALALARAYPKDDASRAWAGSWAVAAVACLALATAPWLGWDFSVDGDGRLLTALVLVSQLFLSLGYLRWLGLCPDQGTGVGLRTILVGGTVLALVPVALGLADREVTVRWLVGVWALVPSGIAVGLLCFRGLTDHRAPIRSQSGSLLGALALGTVPYLVSWMVLPPLGIAPFLVIGAGLTFRSLVHHDTRFPQNRASSFLVSRTRDAVLFLQADGRIQASNPALTALLDRDEASLVGTLPSSLAADGASGRLLGPLEGLTFPDWEGSLAVAHRSGRAIPVHLVFRRVHNPAREAVGAVMLLHDLRLPHRLDLTTREDALTSLSNRRWVLELLEAEFQRARRYGGALAALWIDVERWRDSDDDLRRLAAVLRGGLRKTDFCGRVGETEFLVVLPETAADRAQLAAARLEKMYALASEGDAPGAGLRIGVADLDASVQDSTAFLDRVRASASRVAVAD